MFWTGVLVGAAGFYLLTHVLRVPKMGGGQA